MAYPIIDEIYGPQISWQGQLLAADDQRCLDLYAPGDQWMAYEVIRIVDGIPLFWEDHLARLHRSVQGRLAVPQNLYQESLDLIAANKLPQANLRLVLTGTWRVIHLIPSYYPDPALRSKGVPVGLLEWEREDPNSKIIRSDYKMAVARRFAEPGPFGDYFELLLADRAGLLTEGSRSNLFFIKGNTVFTAPDEKILIGITRKYIMAAIARSGADLEERLFTIEQVGAGEAEAAFISGSPIDVLAIRAIEHFRFDSGQHPLLLKIDRAYQDIVAAYIAGKTNK